MRNDSADVFIFPKLIQPSLAVSRGRHPNDTVPPSSGGPYQTLRMRRSAFHPSSLWPCLNPDFAISRSPFLFTGSAASQGIVLIPVQLILEPPADVRAYSHRAGNHLSRTPDRELNLTLFPSATELESWNDSGITICFGPCFG